MLFETLKKNSTTSPSCITYSLPSLRTLPFSFAATSEPKDTSVSQFTTSARIKPRSKSEWIFPAACGAFVPLVIVQARVSFSPAVRLEIRPSQGVRFFNQPVQSAFAQAEFFHKQRLVLRFHLRKFFFGFRADDKRFAAFVFRKLFHADDVGESVFVFAMSVSLMFAA